MVKEFLSDPLEFKINESKKFWTFIASLFCCFFLMGVAIFITFGIDTGFFNGSFQNRIQLRDLMNHSSVPFHFFILVVGFGPISEELVFRFPLEKSKLSLSIAVATFALMLMLPAWDTIFTLSKDVLVAILIPVVIGVLFFISLSAPLVQILSNIQGKHLVFFSTLAFALMHLVNFVFAEIPLEFWIFSPIFVLPQFIAGYFLAFIRLKIGFWQGVLFHAIINLPSGMAFLASS